MGQFEYTVGLSSVKPEDIPRIAKEYLEKKEKENDEVTDERDSRGARRRA